MASEGYAPEIKYTSLKILNALTHASTNTRNAVGSTWGSVMRNAWVSHPAPSRDAYSYSEGCTADSAEANSTTEKPRFFHIYSSTTGARSAEPSSHSTRSNPSSVTMRFTAPPKSNIVSQISSMAEEGMR